jgi:hypothetical protein
MLFEERFQKKNHDAHAIKRTFMLFDGSIFYYAFRKRKQFGTKMETIKQMGIKSYFRFCNWNLSMEYLEHKSLLGRSTHEFFARNSFCMGVLFSSVRIVWK